MRLWNQFPSLNSTSLHVTTGQHCETPVCKKGCEECASDRAAHNTSRASGELPADTQPHGTMAPPRLNAHTTNTKSDARRTPHQHTDTAERWASPKTRRGHDTVQGPAPTDSPPALQTAQHKTQAGHQANSPPTPSHTERWLPQGSTRTRQTRNRTPGELPAGILTPRNDGPLPKLDADTTQCKARRQRTPRQHTGLAEQRDSPRRSRRTHTTFHTNFIPDQRGGKARRAHDVSTLDQVVPPPIASLVLCTLRIRNRRFRFH